MFLTFLLGLHNYVFIHIHLHSLFQTFLIKNGPGLLLWIIFNIVFYLCQGNGWLEHKLLSQ